MITTARARWGQATAVHLGVLAVLPLLLLVLLPRAVHAQDSPSLAEAAAGLTDGVYVQDGAAEDVAALRGVVSRYADQERLVIAVFAGGVGPVEDAAERLLALTPSDTVILFTPDEVAVSSNLHDDGDVDDAFAAAGQQALGSDAVAAAEALMAELTATPTPIWVFVVPLVAVVGLAVLFGRLRDGQRRRADSSRTIERTRAELRSRLQTAAGEIIELEAHVTIAEDPGITEAMAEVSAGYRDVQWGLERAETLTEVEALRPRMDTVERLLGEIRTGVG